MEVINVFLMCETAYAGKSAYRNKHSSCFIFCFVHFIYRLFQLETQQPESKWESQ